MLASWFVCFHRFPSDIITRRMNAIFIPSQSVHQRNNPKITRFNLESRRKIRQTMINDKIRYVYFIKPRPDKRSCEIIRYRFTPYMRWDHYWYRSHVTKSTQTGRVRARTHSGTHAESMGKRLNWRDYPLVHKEIATSISWCTYVTIKPTCTRLKWGWVCMFETYRYRWN